MGEFPSELESRFELIEEISHGDTGTLFRVIKRDTGEEGVVKLLHDVLTASATERLRITRDFKKLEDLFCAQLAVPTQFDQIGDSVWLFRHWIEGRSLREKLDAEGALSLDDTYAIASELALGLEALHRAGLIHRDIKPENIIVDDKNNAVLIDAAIAPHLPGTEDKLRLGTIPYVSPEAAAGRLVSSRADLYSVGCVLVEMINGEKPFSSQTLEELAAERSAHPVPAIKAELDQDALALVGELLNVDPSLRPFSARRISAAMKPSDSTAAAPRTVKGTMLGMPAISTSPPPPPSAAMAEPRYVDEYDDDEEVATQQVDLEDILSAEELSGMRDAVKRNQHPEWNDEVEDPTRSYDEALDFDDELEATVIKGMPELDPRQLSRSTNPPGEISTTPPVPPPSPAQREALGASTVASTQKKPMFSEAFKKIAVVFFVLFAALSYFKYRVGQNDPELADSHPREVVEAMKQLKHPKVEAPPGDTDEVVVAADTVSKPAPEGVEAKAVEAVEVVDAVQGDEVTDEVVAEVKEEAPAVKPEAVEEPKEVVEEKPESIPAKTTRKTRRERKKRPTAIAKSNSNATSDFATTRSLARAAYAAKDFPEAERLYMRATDLNPRNAGVFAGLAASRLQQRNGTGAAAAYERAVELSPKNVNYWIALGRAHSNAGNKKKSVDAYEQALALDPDNEYALKALGR